MGRIKVMVVDDHPALRFGVRALLEAAGDIDIVAEAEDGAKALAVLAGHRAEPDIMLLDVQMPGHDGITMISRFLAAAPDLRIIMLSAIDDKESVMKAMTLGAYGYIPKRECSQRIIDVIHRVSRGEKVLDGLQTEQMIDALIDLKEKDTRSSFGITQREVELLTHLSEGHSNQEIADAMFISLSTVKRMVDTVVTKLNASNKTQAVVEALKLGII